MNILKASSVRPAIYILYPSDLNKILFLNEDGNLHDFTSEEENFIVYCALGSHHLVNAFADVVSDGQAKGVGDGVHKIVIELNDEDE